MKAKRPIRYTFKFTLRVDDPGDGTLPCESFFDWSATQNQRCLTHEGEMLAYAVKVLMSQPAYLAHVAKNTHVEVEP